MATAGFYPRRFPIYTVLFFLYIFGGIASLILLIIQYVRLALRRQHRTPWSIFLGAGLLMFAVGVGINIWAQYTPQKIYSWQEWVGNGIWILSLLVFIAGAIRCLHAITKANRKVLTVGDEEEAEGVWPPPPRRRN